MRWRRSTIEVADLPVEDYAIVVHCDNRSFPLSVRGWLLWHRADRDEVAGRESILQPIDVIGCVPVLSGPGREILPFVEEVLCSTVAHVNLIERDDCVVDVIYWSEFSC